MITLINLVIVIIIVIMIFSSNRNRNRNRLHGHCNLPTSDPIHRKNFTKSKLYQMEVCSNMSQNHSSNLRKRYLVIISSKTHEKYKQEALRHL